MRFARIIPVVLLVMVMTARDLGAQTVNYYRDLPSLYCSRAVYGSKVRICIKDAPPESLVIVGVGVCDDEPTGIPVKMDPAEFKNEVLRGFADVHGRYFYEFPDVLDNADYVGRTLKLDVLIVKEEQEWQAITCTIPVESPSLLLPSMGPDDKGCINRYDELTEKITTEFSGIEGEPRKILFTREFSRGFALLDEDRIAVFDARMNPRICYFDVGPGLADIVLTRDRKLIAVTRDSLWIFNAETMQVVRQLPQRFALPRGSFNILSVTEDTVIIRLTGNYVGMYNLATGVYRAYELRRNGHFRGKVKDIKKYRDCLLALIVLPDGRACLYVENMQTYDNGFSIPVGNNARRIKLYGREGEPPKVVVLDASGSSEDLLWVFDVFTEAEPRAVVLPDGAMDYDLRSTDGLSVIVYPDEGKARFVDMARLVLDEKSVALPYLTGGAKVYLSRTGPLGFVYSREGLLTVIDAEAKRVIQQISLPGICSGCAVEVY
jgi:hypothetical protein